MRLEVQTRHEYRTNGNFLVSQPSRSRHIEDFSHWVDAHIVYWRQGTIIIRGYVSPCPQLCILVVVWLLLTLSTLKYISVSNSSNNFKYYPIKGTICLSVFVLIVFFVS